MPGQLPTGLGNDQQAMQATAFIRQQPWYLNWIKSLGKTPDANGNVRLDDNQASQLRDMTIKNGIGMNNKYDGIDSNGQIVEEHHKLRNGLIAAAIAAAGATGLGAAGIGPMSGLFGAGAGAGSAAGGAGAAAGGAGTIAGMSIPATEGIASATSLGLPVTAGLGSAGEAMSAIPGLAARGMVSPETMMAPSSTSSMAAGGANALDPAAGGSMVSKLMSGLKDPSNYANLSQILQQGATDAQGNRRLQGSLAGTYDKNMLQAQTDRNATESDALKKLAQTSYILNGHSGYKPANISIAGQSKALPDFGFGYTAPSDAQKQGATDLQAQLMGRLKPGGTYTPMPFSDYGTPGTGETIQDKTGQGLGIAGTIMNMLKGGK